MASKHGIYLGWVLQPHCSHVPMPHLMVKLNTMWRNIDPVPVHAAFNPRSLRQLSRANIKKATNSAPLSSVEKCRSAV